MIRFRSRPRDGQVDAATTLTRQFIRAGDEDEDEGILQLSLTFVFGPTVIAEGNRWCASPSGLDAFIAFVRFHAAFLATADGAPIDVELDMEAAG